MKLRSFALQALFILCMSGVYAQTMPIPFNLSSGNFQFAYWDSLSAAGSYPAGMIFQFVPSNHTAPFYDDSATDFSCPYNLSKRPRINGYRNLGIGFVSTSNSQYNDCVSGAGDQRFMGSALLSLNTTDRQNVKVSWKSETLLPGDGNGTPSNPRVWRLRLQYRVGENGNFTDVPGPIEFISGLSTGDSVTFGPTSLPQECFNKPVVQLRWIYYESSAGNAGTRPRLRLDDITVTSENMVGLEEFENSALCLFPNPAQSYFTIQNPGLVSGTLSIWNQQGQQILEKNLREVNERIDCSRFPRGLYRVRFISEGNYRTYSSGLILK